MDQPSKLSRPNPKTLPDTVGPVAAAPASATAINPKIAPLLRDAFAGLHAVGASTGYTASLVALRQTDGAPALIAQAYHAAPDYEYLQRWSVATVLGDLHQPDALEPLHAIAVAPLPKVAGPDVDRILVEETIIRVAAVEGIASQAAGNPSARALLLKSVESPVFSVRRTAAQAYLAQGGARADLEKVIPADQRFLLDIRPISASQLPTTTPPKTTPRREAPAPGTPGAPAPVAAPDASHAK